MTMLTTQQARLLKFIDRFSREHGFAPTLDQMAEELNLSAKSGVHRIVNGLEERGYIRRLHHRARAIEVVSLPDGHSAPTRTQLSRLGTDELMAVRAAADDLLVQRQAAD